MDEMKNNNELNEVQLENANGGLAQGAYPDTRSCPRCGTQMQLVNMSRKTRVYNCPRCQQKYTFPR